MSDKKKYVLSTDTDMHFGMLADQSKLKIVPDLTNVTKLEKVDEKSDSDSDIINNNNSIDSDDFNIKEVIINNNVARDSRTPSPDYSQLNNNEKKDFEKQKIIHDYVQKSRDDSYINSQVQHSEQEPKNENPTVNDLNNMDEIPFHMLDENTQKFKKMEKYAQLLGIKRTGITLTKDYNINSDYDEMSFEVEYWTNYQKKRDAVDLGKNCMVNAVTAMEFLNESYDPFGLKLKGWSEQIELNKQSYDSVFGELYQKYRSSGKKMEPEIKLLLMISASAASFHASKKMAESLPGLDSVLNSNPELLGKIQTAINNNISNQGKKDEDEDEKKKRQEMYDQMQKLKEQQSRFNDLKKAQQEVNNNTQRIQEQMNMMDKVNKNDGNVSKGNISSILNKIKAENVARKADAAINNLSDSSSSRVSLNKDSDANESMTMTLDSAGKPRKRKKGKSTISITTS